jgi:D-alanine-D-alanine ligase-like ATP-grasp enzyme
MIRHGMDRDAWLYYKSALRLKLPLRELTKSIAGFEVAFGKKHYFFLNACTPFNSDSSISIASNKFCMNKLLELSGFPVPKARAFNHEQFKSQNIEILLENLRFPLVAKPTINSLQGRDVLCHITNSDQLKKHMEDCYKRHSLITIEEFHENLKYYRVLVFYNKVIGVLEGVSARVIGDGTHTINELIHITNRDRAPYIKECRLDPIKVDYEIQMHLEYLQLTLDSIPKNGETVVLSHTCNPCRGAELKSLGKKICKENARLLCKAANSLGLNYVGFDIVCENILIPIEKSRGVIIEANYHPAITIHENPAAGTPIKVSKKVVQRLILQHPWAYLLGLNKDPVIRLYMRVTLVLSVLIGLLYTAMRVSALN